MGRHALQLALVILTVLLILPAIAHAIDVWLADEEFGFGFLVLPTSLFLVWLRRDTLRRAMGNGADIGLWIVLAALALYLAAGRIAIHALAGIAVVPLLWGMAIYLWGWGAARVLAFPISFLLFGLGLYRGLLDSVGFALQQVTAHGASVLTPLLGIPVVRDGLTLSGNGFAFVVAEPCSGMSSLLSLLALSTLWIYVAGGAPARRLALVLAVPPLVIVANTLRVTSVLIVAAWFGPDAAAGFFHSASSLVLFGVALAGLLSISRMIGCQRLNPAI